MRNELYSSDWNGNILIIGGCVAAKECAEAIRKRNSICNITILSEENYYPYYRPMLSKCMMEDVNEKRFYLTSVEAYEKENITVKLGEKATEFSPDKKLVKTNKGNTYSYDKILIATGSKNFVPIPDALNIPGVFSIRKYDDAKKTRKWITSISPKHSKIDGSASPKAIVVGGGLLGLEAAWELKSNGIEVTVIELAPRILPVQIDEEASDFLSEIIRSKGVHLVLGKSVQKVFGKEKVTSVALNDGKILECDMLLFSVGVRPNIDLVKDSGLEINRGILVNNKMETSLKDVYAAGDVSEIKGSLTGVWLPALEQGRVAGANMVGDEVLYTNPPVSNFLNSFGTRVYSIGNTDCATQVETTKKSIDPYKGIYKKLYFKEDILVGGILIGDTKNSMHLSKGIKNKISKEEALSLL